MQFPKILILIATTMAALGSGCDVAEPSEARSIVVREATLDGPRASYLVEVDEQLRQVDRIDYEREVVVTIADPSGDMLAAAVEHGDGLDYFDADLARSSEAPGDAATQTLLDLAIADDLPLPGTPLPSFRRWRDPSDEENQCFICGMDGSYWFCQFC